MGFLAGRLQVCLLPVSSVVEQMFSSAYDKRIRLPLPG
jgi:hypothetical protein